MTWRANGTVLVLAMTVAALGVTAQEPPAADEQAAAEEQAAIDEEAAHDALRELRKIYEQAVNEKRPELLRPHLDDEFSGVMVTGELVTSYDELVAYWEDMQKLIGEGGTYTTALEPDLSWIHGDIAVAKGSTRDHVVAGSGNEYDFTSRWTGVLVNRDGAWKIRRMQGTMNPVENEFVAVIAKEAAKWAAIVAGVVALLVGFGVGFYARGWKRS